MLDSMKKKVSERSGEAATAAREQWKVVEQRFAEMKAASGEQWAKARDAFRDAYDALERKLRD
jgi:hypothetical protein